MSGKQTGQMLADIFLIIVLETPEAAGMEQDQDDHNLRITHTIGLVAILMGCILNHIFFLLDSNSLQKSSAIQ